MGTFSRGLIAVAVVLCCAPSIAAASHKLSLMQRIERLESIAEAQGQGAAGQGSAATADIVSRLDELRLELSRLRGELELQAHRIDQLSKAQRAMYAEIDRRLGQGGSAQMPEEAPEPSDQSAPPGYQPPVPAYQAPGTGYQPQASGYEVPGPSYQGGVSAGEKPEGAAGLASVPALPPPEPATAPAAPPAASPTPGVPAYSAREDARYTAAFKLLKAGHYDESAKAFRALVADYPNGRYADNAQYWLGESAYVRRDFKTALAEFRKVTQGFPASPKTPDALLKTGYIYYETAQWADARRTLNEVVQRYPTSTAARLARQRLQQMDRDHH